MFGSNDFGIEPHTRVRTPPCVARINPTEPWNEVYEEGTVFGVRGRAISVVQEPARPILWTC
jgi:hypothetical protein